MLTTTNCQLNFYPLLYGDADVDYCASNPCMNGAECRRVSGGFACNPCPLNVTGFLCQFGTLNNCRIFGLSSQLLYIDFG